MSQSSVSDFQVGDIVKVSLVTVERDEAENRDGRPFRRTVTTLTWIGPVTKVTPFGDTWHRQGALTITHGLLFPFGGQAHNEPDYVFELVERPAPPARVWPVGTIARNTDAYYRDNPLRIRQQHKWVDGKGGYQYDSEGGDERLNKSLADRTRNDWVLVYDPEVGRHS